MILTNPSFFFKPFLVRSQSNLLMDYFSLPVMWSLSEKANRHGGMVISVFCPDDMNGISHNGDFRI